MDSRPASFFDLGSTSQTESVDGHDSIPLSLSVDPITTTCLDHKVHRPLQEETWGVFQIPSVSYDPVQQGKAGQTELRGLWLSPRLEEETVEDCHNEQSPTKLDVQCAQVDAHNGDEKKMDEFPQKLLSDISKDSSLLQLKGRQNDKKVDQDCFLRDQPEDDEDDDDDSFVPGEDTVDIFDPCQARMTPRGSETSGETMSSSAAMADDGDDLLTDLSDNEGLPSRPATSTASTSTTNSLTTVTVTKDALAALNAESREVSPAVAANPETPRDKSSDVQDSTPVTEDRIVADTSTPMASTPQDYQPSTAVIPEGDASAPSPTIRSSVLKTLFAGADENVHEEPSASSPIVAISSTESQHAESQQEYESSESLAAESFETLMVDVISRPRYVMFEDMGMERRTDERVPKLKSTRPTSLPSPPKRSMSPSKPANYSSPRKSMLPVRSGRAPWERSTSPSSRSPAEPLQSSSLSPRADKPFVRPFSAGEIKSKQSPAKAKSSMVRLASTPNMKAFPSPATEKEKQSPSCASKSSMSTYDQQQRDRERSEIYHRQLKERELLRLKKEKEKKEQEEMLERSKATIILKKDQIDDLTNRLYSYAFNKSGRSRPSSGTFSPPHSPASNRNSLNGKPKSPAKAFF